MALGRIPIHHPMVREANVGRHVDVLVFMAAISEVSTGNTGPAHLSFLDLDASLRKSKRNREV